MTEALPVPRAAIPAASAFSLPANYQALSCNMSTLNCQLIPGPDGTLTARPVLGDQLLQSTVTTSIAEATGVEAAKVELVIKAFLDKIMDAAAKGRWSPGLYQRLAFRPACNPQHRDPRGTARAADIGVGVALAFTPRIISDWQERVTVSLAPFEPPATCGHAAELPMGDDVGQLSSRDAAGLLAAAG